MKRERDCDSCRQTSNASGPLVGDEKSRCRALRVQLLGRQPRERVENIPSSTSDIGHFFVAKMTVGATFSNLV